MCANKTERLQKASYHIGIEKSGHLLVHVSRPVLSLTIKDVSRVQRNTAFQPMIGHSTRLMENAGNKVQYTLMKVIVNPFYRRDPKK
jgi:hypothetical protein